MPDMSAAGEDQLLGRFGISNQPQIRKLLSEVIQQPQTSQELKALCQRYMEQDTVPWKLVQQACSTMRSCNDHVSSQSTAPAICQASSLVFHSPPARQRSKQLQEKLAELQYKLDQQQYSAMVADVTQLEQQAAAAMEDPFFPTTRLQISFGLHVLVTMGTFFALGYYGGRFLFPSNKAWAALLGALGLTSGLLLETTLLMLRMNMPAPLERKYAHLMSKSWDQGTAKAAAAAATAAIGSRKGSFQGSSGGTGNTRQQQQQQRGQLTRRQGTARAPGSSSDLKGHAKHD